MKHLFFSLILRSFLVCCNLLLIIHSPLLAQSFQPAINYNAGTTPASVAVGDFNGDGKLDLVSANRGSNNVSVLLNNGAGGFGAAINFPVGTTPFSVAVGDFNGDGRLDLAISNGGSDNVSVLLGNGVGSFGAAINFPAGNYPTSVAVGDINNDGKLDLVTANFNSNTVSVLLGDGLGAFGTAINFPAGNSPAYAAMGDLNGDGNQDLAIANYNGSNAISILLSDGAGGFTPSTVVNGLGGQPFMIAVRDLNSDGKLDVALANRSTNVVVLPGDGTGGFAAPSLFGVGITASSVAVGDFNGDGKLDLTIANFNSNTVSVLLGDGLGAFGTATHLSVGARPQSVAVGDFNGDGRPDLAAANLNTNNISVLLNEIVTPPVAQDDMATTTSGTPVAITVTANDTALYGNTLNVGTVTIINPASNGSLSVNTTTGEVTYSPSPACFVGQDSFTYTINDNTGLTSNTATVTIDVQALPLTLTNFASSPAVVCTGSPITFTATVGNASCGYSYTLTDGNSTTTGSSSNTDFSQSLTPAGSGLRSFTLTLVNNALSASATTDVTLSTPASATIAYAGSPFSTTSAAVNVTRTGTAGGTFTASPSGLSLNASTGQITPASSTPGNYTVIYTVAASGGCPVFSTTARLTIQAASSTDLRINLVAAGPTAVPGDQILYVTGIIGTDAENVILTNVLPASVTFISSTLSSAIGPPVAHSTIVTGNIVQLTIPNLPSGRHAFGVQIRIDPASTGTLTTTSSITANTANRNPSDNTTELSLTLTPQADLSVTLTDAQTAVQAGSPVTYTLVVANSGLSNAPNATVINNLPASLTGVSWTASGTGGGTTAQVSGYGNLNQTLNLPVGGSVRFVITGTLSASATGSLTNTASVASAAGVSDPDETNNSVTNTATIIPLTLPSISGFSALSNNVCAGSPVSFTASVGNVTGSYAYTLTNGTSIAIGSSSSTSFSRSLTPAGSGLQSFTLTLVNNALSASATTDVTLSTPASATIAYAGSPFSTTSAPVNVTRTGTAGGTFTASPSGLSIDANTGQITPASSTPGNYTVTYTVAASGGCSIFSTIATLAIQPPANQKPVAVDDDVDVLSNTTTPGNVLTNDTDPDGHSLAASLVVTPINGTIILNADGSFSYSPNLGFIGRDSLTYQICDSPASSMPSLCDSAKVYFNVQSNAPTLTGLMATVSAVCAGSPVTFTATIGNLTGAYNFTLTNGTSTTNGNSSSIVFNQRILAAGSGSQSFTLTVEAGGQQTAATAAVTVNTLPVATLSANKGGILTCTQTSLTLTAGGGDTYSFAGPGIVSQDATLGRATVNASGFYSVTVSASGCTSTTSITIGQDNNVPLVSISANPSLTITSGQSTTLTASGATSYIWSTGEIANFIVVNATGPYSLTGTTGNGCSATTSVVVSLTTAPAGPFSITGVTANTCQQIASNRYVISFTPLYTGTNGQPISFSVVNELFPSTAPGPYTLQLYTDNPTITLTAQQGGTPGEASFVYNWLTACTSSQTNSPPRVNQPLTDQVARVGEGFGYTIPQVTFTDNESPQSLVLRVSGLPAGLSFSLPNQIGGVPTTAGVGSVTVTATDPQGLSVSTSFILTVVEPTATNTPPTLVNPIASQAGIQGQPFSLNISNTFTDAQTPNALVLTASGLPAGLNLSGTTIAGTPSVSGTSTVSLTAVDPGGLSATTSFMLTIQPASATASAPFAITGVNPLTCTQISSNRYEISFTPLFSGLNGQAVNFWVTNELFPTTAPGPYSLQLYNDNPTIVLKATQGGSPGEASFTYNWLANCSAPQPNTPPRVNIPLTNQTAQRGQGFGYTIPQTTFTDNESPHSLVLTVTGLPVGMSFSPPTQIGGVPTQPGVSTVTVTATDPGGLSVPATFVLTVLPAGQTSGFAITGVQTLSCASASGGRRSVSFSPQYSGLDGSPVSFSVVNELLPTTASGPYTLELYTDNPTLRLRAQQGGATVSYDYNWLAACNAPARHGLVESGSGLQVKVLGNPVTTAAVSLEISGITGQSATINLVNLQGKPLAGKRIERAEDKEHILLPVDGWFGVLLLEVRTATEYQVLRLIQK